MPKALEAKLKKQGRSLLRRGKLHKSQGETGKEALAAYVYGTMRKTGWKPQRERK